MQRTKSEFCLAMSTRLGMDNLAGMSICSLWGLFDFDCFIPFNFSVLRS